MRFIVAPYQSASITHLSAKFPLDKLPSDPWERVDGMTLTMRAIALRQPGETEELKLEERPIPVAAENQALIEIKTCGLNYMDVP